MDRVTFTRRERRPKPVTREAVLIGIKGGDSQAWQDLYSTYWHWLLSICLNTGVPYADAEELVQKVFVRVNENIKEFVYDRTRGRFSGWLVVILGNLTIDYWRRRSHDPLSRGTRQPSKTTTGTAPLHRLAGSKKDQVVDQVLARELNRVFQQAYKELRAQVPAKHWRVFEAYSINDRPAKEVAAEEGMAPGTVYSIDSRLIAQLRPIILRMLNER